MGELAFLLGDGQIRRHNVQQEIGPKECKITCMKLFLSFLFRRNGTVVVGMHLYHCFQSIVRDLGRPFFARFRYNFGQIHVLLGVGTSCREM